jgi:hypothetical protein
MSRLLFLMLGLLLFAKATLCTTEESTKKNCNKKTPCTELSAQNTSENSENRIGFFKENFITTGIVMGLVAIVTYIYYRHIQQYDHQTQVSRINNHPATPVTPKPQFPQNLSSDAPRLAASPFPQQQLLRSYSSQSLTSTMGKSLPTAVSEANLGAHVIPTPIQIPKTPPLIHDLEELAKENLLSPGSSPTRQFQTYRDMLNAAKQSSAT